MIIPNLLIITGKLSVTMLHLTFKLPDSSCSGSLVGGMNDPCSGLLHDTFSGACATPWVVSDASILCTLALLLCGLPVDHTSPTTNSSYSEIFIIIEMLSLYATLTNDNW